MEGAVVGSGASQVRVSSAGDAVVIEVHGVLDEAAVRSVGEAASGALGTQGARIRVDLAHVAGYTDGGVTAFSALQSRFRPEAGRRVVYQASSGPGQEALLAAYSRTA